jgi:hypothetical protein
LPVKLFCHDDWVVDKKNVQIWAAEVPVGTKIYEVHVSVGGYLSTSYQALPIGDHFTILSGWHPDSTSWLVDTPQIFGEELLVKDPYQPLNFNRLNCLPRNGFGGGGHPWKS